MKADKPDAAEEVDVADKLVVAAGAEEADAAMQPVEAAAGDETASADAVVAAGGVDDEVEAGEAATVRWLTPARFCSP